MGCGTSKKGDVHDPAQSPRRPPSPISSRRSASVKISARSSAGAGPAAASAREPTAKRAKRVQPSKAAQKWCRAAESAAAGGAPGCVQWARSAPDEGLEKIFSKSSTVSEDLSVCIEAIDRVATAAIGQWSFAAKAEDGGQSQNQNQTRPDLFDIPLEQARSDVLAALPAGEELGTSLACVARCCAVLTSLSRESSALLPFRGSVGPIADAAWTVAAAGVGDPNSLPNTAAGSGQTPDVAESVASGIESFIGGAGRGGNDGGEGAALGFSVVPCWMDRRVRGALLHLCAVRGGQRRGKVKVRRDHALADLVSYYERCDGDRESLRAALFPTFVGARGLEEPGEGHGPRKEAFMIASAQLGEDWADLPAGHAWDGARVSVRNGRAEVRISGASADAGAGSDQPRPGDRILVAPSNAPVPHHARHGAPAAAAPYGYRGVIVSMEPDPDAGAGPAGAALAVRTDEIVEMDGDDLALVVQRKVGAPLSRVAATGEFFFNAAVPDSERSRTRAAGCGWLCGAAIANRVAVELPVSLAAFQWVLDPEWRPSARDATLHDPDFAEGAARINAMSESDAAAMCAMEEVAVPAGADSRKCYVDHLAGETLGAEGSSIRWAVEAFCAGFWSAVDRDSLAALGCTPLSLRDVVCPSAGTEAQDHDADFDIRAVFRVVEEPDLARCFPAFRDALWDVIDTLDPGDKRALVRFVTGRPYLPVPHEEPLRIEMPFAPILDDEFRAIIGTLPQAHTCSNTIELPNYFEALEKTGAKGNIAAMARVTLKDRLLLAIHASEGYDLDAIPDGQGDRTRQGQGSVRAPGSAPGQGQPEHKSRNPPPPPRDAADDEIDNLLADL